MILFRVWIFFSAKQINVWAFFLLFYFLFIEQIARNKRKMFFASKFDIQQELNEAKMHFHDIDNDGIASKTLQWDDCVV